ncbi:hypothetical protein SASPL_150271 [Salvia splendens]|uniref:Uncharacterized protein n=1 Tax=Salvia splendens TaxID=180675 RepID=A0A8X8W696_SALSN|nr:uncharacterized protein LOC121781398 [Salvia splendens]KAG6388835.1 hypothetical protein SASPL_150271 [Salvia splendens]
MPTSPTCPNGHTTPLLPKEPEPEPPHSAPAFRWTGRQTPSGSFDSSFRSSSFSFNDDFPTFSPPLIKFKGVPFSWEQIPGIPKHHSSKKKDSSGHLLPLPPAAVKKQEEISPKKSNRFQSDDPFFAALVECSKDGGINDDDDDRCLHSGAIGKGSSKITRTLSDRFGLINMYTSSCKRTCAVSESIVNLPRQTPHYLIDRRSS